MIYLHGLGHFHPENVITNKFLEDLDIGTTEDWIVERVGVLERRTVLPLDYIRETKNIDPRATCEARLYSDAQMGVIAAKMALERAGIGAGEIGMVISGSSLPENVTPPEAASVACQLGIDVPCFDLNSACSTFGVQMHFLNMMQPEKMPPYILVLSIETVTLSVDFSDRNAAVLFGDASTAAVVSTTIPSTRIFKDTGMSSQPSMSEKVVVPRWKHFRQDGNAVQKFAIRKTTELLRNIRASVKDEDISRFLFIGHQANLGVLRTACEMTGIAEENHWHNVTHFGNVGSAGAPSVLSERWDDLQTGDFVAIAVVGAGLTWAQLSLIKQ
ncbi:MAG: ketoacyl-ACP synthase III [Syntrophales bacterium]|nr:ketoacyl-ACP synthase III [Syntrophales bacterium]